MTVLDTRNSSSSEHNSFVSKRSQLVRSRSSPLLMKRNGNRLQRHESMRSLRQRGGIQFELLIDYRIRHATFGDRSLTRISKLTTPAALDVEANKDDNKDKDEGGPPQCDLPSESEHSLHLNHIFPQQKLSKEEQRQFNTEQEKIDFLLRNPKFMVSRVLRKTLRQNDVGNASIRHLAAGPTRTPRRPIKCEILNDKYRLPKLNTPKDEVPALSALHSNLTCIDEVNESASCMDSTQNSKATTVAGVLAAGMNKKAQMNNLLSSKSSMASSSVDSFAFESSSSDDVEADEEDNADPTETGDASTCAPETTASSNKVEATSTTCAIDHEPSESQREEQTEFDYDQTETNYDETETEGDFDDPTETEVGDETTDYYTETEAGDETDYNDPTETEVGEGYDTDTALVSRVAVDESDLDQTETEVGDDDDATDTALLHGASVDESEVDDDDTSYTESVYTCTESVYEYDSCTESVREEDDEDDEEESIQYNLSLYLSTHSRRPADLKKGNEEATATTTSETSVTETSESTLRSSLLSPKSGSYDDSEYTSGWEDDDTADFASVSERQTRTSVKDSGDMKSLQIRNRPRRSFSGTKAVPNVPLSKDDRRRSMFVKRAGGGTFDELTGIFGSGHHPSSKRRSSKDKHGIDAPKGKRGVVRSKSMCFGPSNSNSSDISSSGRSNESSRRHPRRTKSGDFASNEGSRRGPRRVKSGATTVSRDSFITGSRIKKYNNSTLQKSGGHSLSPLEKLLQSSAQSSSNTDTRSRRASISRSSISGMSMSVASISHSKQ